MVLEAIIGPSKAEKRPWEMFFIGLLWGSVGVLLSLWIFPDHSSLVMVFLTVLASVPIMYNTMRLEEKKDLEIRQERFLIKEHGRALSFFMFMFLGFVVAYSVFYLVLPSGTLKELFGVQTTTIEQINSRVVKIVTGQITAGDALWTIFANNVRVLLFAIFFSFFFGAGAIFILTWNASVIATAIGNFVRSMAPQGGYFAVYHLGLLRYLIHGIPEILAYFIGGLAGGIISVAVIRHDFYSKEFNHILLDSLDLIGIAILTLIIAALTEVFITPMFF